MGRTDKTTNTPSPEWAKHLRPKGKRKFWRKIRRKTKLKLGTGRVSE